MLLRIYQHGGRALEFLAYIKTPVIRTVLNLFIPLIEFYGSVFRGRSLQS